MSGVRETRGAMTVVLGADPLVEQAFAGLTWASDPEGVREAANLLRRRMAPVMPGAAHEALARLQQALGERRCTLLTFAVDGLLQKAAAADAVELGGSLWRLRCSEHLDHPRVGIFGDQAPGRTCSVCGAPLRPDIVLPSEPSDQLPEALEAVARSRVLLAVEADASHDDVTSLLEAARARGARCWEIHPTGHPACFDKTLLQGADAGLPRLVGRWLAEV